MQTIVLYGLKTNNKETIMLNKHSFQVQKYINVQLV